MAHNFSAPSYGKGYRVCRDCGLLTARAYGVGRIALFGSYARGEATPQSDIDLRLIDMGEIRGFFKLSGFQLALEDSLGVHVDVLTTDALSESFLSEISKDEVIVYEQQAQEYRYSSENTQILRSN